MSGVPVVRCEPRHVEALVRLVERVRADEHGLAGTAAVLGRLREALAAGRPFWVALHGADVVGCVGLERLDARTGILRALFVDAARRRGGTGRALLAALVEAARAEGFTRVVLDSHPAFRAAHRFYEHEGFTRLEPAQEPPGFSRTFRGNVAFGLALDLPGEAC